MHCLIQIHETWSQRKQIPVLTPPPTPCVILGTERDLSGSLFHSYKGHSDRPVLLSANACVRSKQDNLYENLR